MRIGFFLFFSALLLSANIDTSITEKKELLDKKEYQEDMLGKKISELAKEILIEQREYDKVAGEIKEIEITIDDSRTDYEIKNKKLRNALEEQDSLLEKKREIEKKVVEILAKELSFSIIRNNLAPTYTDDLITEEVIKGISDIAKNDINTLKDEHIKVVEKIARLKNDIADLKTYIESQEKKKTNLLTLREKRKTIIASLDSKKSNYKKELLSIENEKNELKKILQELKLVKNEQEKNAKLEAQKRSIPSKEAESGEDEVIDVRQIASSYHTVSTTKYSGKKTIAPLDEFDIEQKFGPYYDPVYKLKVFNESVILNSKKSDAKVKSVLDGKVIFAKETPVLNKVVIVEHPGNLHTVYANLSAIAPTVKQGAYVKKGYVIGRVDNKLTFEVTKKNTHIDPLELIALN